MHTALRFAIVTMTAITMMAAAGCQPGSISPGAGMEGLPTISRADAIYRLNPGDEIEVTVFGEEELSGEFQINADGEIAFPLIGRVNAAGMSINEFTDSLEARLRDGYIRDPRANVEVLNFPPYYVLGEIGSPGPYDYSPNLTVVNAAAIAGGFTYRTDLRRVMIKHENSPAEIEYSLTTTTPVQPGDTIRFLERRF